MTLQERSAERRSVTAGGDAARRGDGVGGYDEWGAQDLDLWSNLAKRQARVRADACSNIASIQIRQRAAAGPAGAEHATCGASCARMRDHANLGAKQAGGRRRGSRFAPSPRCNTAGGPSTAVAQDCNDLRLQGDRGSAVKHRWLATSAVFGIKPMPWSRRNPDRAASRSSPPA